eukprot:m.29183 g.29183  ORF g.29183 m.29183 type:complete len:647 (+) comp6655_c0_seq2:534-2474(+)
MADREEKIAQLKMIANAPEDLCREVLAGNGWNVANALELLVGGGGSGGGGGGGGLDPGLFGSPPEADPTDVTAQWEARNAAAEAIATAEVARLSLNDGDPDEHTEARREAEVALSRAGTVAGAMPILGEMERIVSRGSARSSEQDTIPFVVSFLGNEVSITVPSDGNVQRLKRQLQDRTGVPVEKQVLMGWTGAEPAHDGTVLNSVIHLPTTEPVRLILWVEDGLDPPTPQPAVLRRNPIASVPEVEIALPPAASSGPDTELIHVPSEPSSRASSPSIQSVDGVTDDDEDDEDYGLSPDFDESCFDDSAVLPSAATRLKPMVPAKCSDPYEVANHFADSFAERYQKDGVVLPAFYRAPLFEAMKDAEASAKPLLVYMHSDDLQFSETQVFCSESLSTATVAEFINENYVLWGTDVTSTLQRIRFERSSGAQQLMQHISTQHCPGLYALVKLPGRLEMVGCVEGFEDSQTLFLKLFQFRETAEEHLKELHREVARRTAAEDLRRQQEAEFEESLRQDREKQKAKDEAAAIEAVRLAEIAAQEEYSIQREISAGAKVPSEPDQSDKAALKIQFRLPGGSKCERRFNPTDTLGNLLHFLHSEGKPANKFATFHIPRPGQKISINDKDLDTTLAEFGLHKRDLLYVEELD